jgi:hypothetical protein
MPFQSFEFPGVQPDFHEPETREEQRPAPKCNLRCGTVRRLHAPYAVA